MKQFSKSKMFWISFILLATGVIFGYLENTFYQYIDENGVLRESWLMPLAYLCIFSGAIGFSIVAVKAIWRTLKNA